MFPSPVRRATRGIGAAIRARPGVFAAAALTVLVLSILVPPLVLSLARKRVDYFTFNPWLKRMPEYLASDGVPWSRKLEAVSDLALFWFSADSPYGGIEWGFAVDVSDLIRTTVVSGLFGAYFALWSYRRAAGERCGVGVGPTRPGGVAGMLTSVLGLSTSPCSVVGCGAPVLPVVGLAFAGLSSGTLSLMAGVSRVATTTVLIAVTVGVAYFGWLAGARPSPRLTPEASSSPPSPQTPSLDPPGR